jgi:oligosaccharyltransferase complex subunit gamma
MKLLHALTLGLLPITALAAKKAPPSTDKFDRLHAQQLASGALKLDDASFVDVVRVPRNYSAAILLTAREQRFGCTLCKEFQPEWDLLAKSWVNGDKAGESRVVFGTLDFSDGKAAFQQLQLQTVPILVIYGPTVGKHAKPAGEPERWSFSDGYV